MVAMMTSLCLVTLLLQAKQPADRAAHRAQMITVDHDIQLEVLDFGGKGRPLVLLAGAGDTAHVFDNFAPKLASFGHVFAVTRRGYGASTKAESGYDVARLGEDVLAVLDHLTLGRPVLIGHSIAGQELSYLASKHADRLVGVVYLEAAYRYAYDVPGEFEKDFPSLPPPPSIAPPTPKVARVVFPDAEGRQLPEHPGAKEAILKGSQRFTEIHVPALAIFASPHDVMTGDFEKFDEALTERQARAFERGVPQARVLRWPHASHYLFIAQERDVLREVKAFLAALPTVDTLSTAVLSLD
jgi:pimeloyl-ACP methyl ester carboxylesterase